MFKKALKKGWREFVRLDKFLDRHFWLLFVLLVVIIVRVPYFFEPHYYMDEGIYLTIGQSIGKGLALYRDLFDHKTPLIYWLAAGAGTFFSWRVIHFCLSLFMAAAFYRLGEKLLSNKIAVVVSSLVFVLSTNLPAFEGNVLNGELLAMTFVLGAVTVLLSKTQRRWSWLLSGGLFGLAFLTKFHATFDLMAMAPLLLLPWQKKISWQKIKFFASGFVLVNLLVVLYFLISGDLLHYIYSAFIYNFAYSTYSNYQVNVLLITAMVLAWVIYAIWQWRQKKNKLDATLLFTGGWLIMTLAAANLSGRAYPHYFLQVWPALSLALGLLISHLLSERFNKKWLSKTVKKPAVIILLILALLTLVIYRQMTITKVKVRPYYQNFWQYFTKQQSREDYIRLFGAITSDNYKIAPFLKQTGEQQLLIFGNNPTLYSIVNMQPVTLPFVTNFHHYDFVNNELSIYDDRIYNYENDPTSVNYVVTMKQIDGHEQEKIDQQYLMAWLQTGYRAIYDGESLILWQRK